jgi:protease-4
MKRCESNIYHGGIAMKGRGLLIALSIVVGIVLACGILPLGGMALLLAAVGGGSATSATPLPATTWQEQVLSGGENGFIGNDDRVLVLRVSGTIGMTEVDFGSSQLSHRELLSQIDQATSDPRIKAVVLRVNSPGGGVVASNEIYNELQELNDSGKPLVVSMGSTAASGGYYIATPADYIYANPDTFTGSLGVIIMLLNYEETLDIVGLEQVIFKSGEFKDIGSPARELSPEEEEILQEIVDQAYQGFVDVIVEGRDLPREDVLEIADGRIYTGQQALELGLIDELGGLDAAIAKAQELADLPTDGLVVEYNTAPEFFDLLTGTMEQSQRPADPLNLEILTEPQTPRLEYRLVMP